MGPFARVLLTCALLASCGAPRRPPPRVEEVVVARRITPPTPAPEVAAPARPSGRPYAPTPISEVGEALTDLALAATQSAALPTPTLPTRRALEEPHVIWQRGLEDEPSAGLTVLAFAFEIELFFKRGEPARDAEGAARWGSVRATVALSRHGLRLVSLRPRAMSSQARGGTPPPGMEGLPALARELTDAIRAGDVTRYELTDDDRRLLSNDAVWAQAQEERLIHARVPEMQRMLRGMPTEPIAYGLDDIAILARTADDRLVTLNLELDPHQGSFALATAPLVTVHLLWPPPARPTSWTAP
ncbi:MAG: hypothetical protein RID81_12965 [Sandaracinaceae bacterium]